MRLLPWFLALLPTATIVALTSGSPTGPRALPASPANASTPRSHQVQQSAPTPMELFKMMLPVIRHERCSNCHGGVDPISGNNHGPGSVDPKLTPCENCHISGWELPAQQRFFPTKTDREVCGLFSDFAAKQGHGLFITNHLRGDHLIVAAFEGKMGGVGDMGGMRDPTDPAEKPPMDQDAFIELAKDWLNRGHAACDVEGTITLVETVESVDAWQIAPSIYDTVRQEGIRTATIKLSGGAYHAEIKMEGSIVGTHVAHLSDANGRPCTSTMVNTKKYSGEGNGRAKVAAKDTVFFGDTDPALGQTDYRIDVELPAEEGRSSNRFLMSNDCGIPVPDLEGDDLELKWEPATFTLEGHLDDRKTGNLVGSCDRMVTVADRGDTKGVREMECNRFGNMGNRESPGLTWLANTAYHDGRSIEFRVQTFWNIRYRK